MSARRGRLDGLLSTSDQPDLCGSSDERLNACGRADWVAVVRGQAAYPWVGWFDMTPLGGNPGRA
jgi:hypothetical protein